MNDKQNDTALTVGLVIFVLILIWLVQWLFIYIPYARLTCENKNQEYWVYSNSCESNPPDECTVAFGKDWKYLAGVIKVDILCTNGTEQRSLISK